MKPSIVLTLMILGGAFSPIYAQTSEVLDVVKEVIPLTDGEKEKLERVTETYTHTQKRNVTATANQVVDPLLQRAREMQQRQAEYAQKLSNGEVRRFPHVVEKWEDYQKQAAEIGKLYEEFKSEGDQSEKEALMPVILEKVQPIGRFFKSANHDGYVTPTLTQAKVDEERSLMKEFNNAPSSDEEEGELNLVTPNNFYTLKHIPMPIQFSAPEGTKVYLASKFGGQFPNGTDYMIIEADENNIASTWWVSHGDGVAACNVEYRSAEFPYVGQINVYVKSPFLMDLETLSPVVKKVAQKATQTTEQQLNQ